MPYEGIHPFQLNAARLTDRQAIHLFNQPITIEISYDPADLGGIDPSALGLFWHDDERGVWMPVNIDHDYEHHRIVAQIGHFTNFALGNNDWENHKISNLDAVLIHMEPLDQ